MGVRNSWANLLIIDKQIAHTPCDYAISANQEWNRLLEIRFSNVKEVSYEFFVLLRTMHWCGFKKTPTFLKLSCVFGGEHLHTFFNTGIPSVSFGVEADQIRIASHILAK